MVRDGMPDAGDDARRDAAHDLSVGLLLKRYRKAAGLTQEALAQRAGYSSVYIGMLERDKARPLPATVRLLAAALDLSPDDLGALESAAVPDRSPAPGWPSLHPHVAHAPLIGREREVAMIVPLLRREGMRVVTLTGPGGVGKTRLAERLAQETGRLYRDKPVFVPLAAAEDPTGVVAAIAYALGVQEGGGRALPESVADALRARHALLILDNFEHVLEAATLVAALVATCPRLVVLVTSRAALRLSGEQEVAIPPLALPDRDRRGDSVEVGQAPAVRLFVQRAQAVQPHFALTPENAPTVAAICRRLDGLPLAIELAAARVKVLPLPALLERLEQRLDVLTGGPRDVPPRQRTMRDTIAWSYDLLDYGEQLLLRCLFVFVGGCGLGAIDAVYGALGEANTPVLDAVSSLIDKSLIRRDEAVDDEPRYGLLETIRAYALERANERGEAGILRRHHARYYLALAERAEEGIRGGDQATWLDRLDREHDNLRAALHWALERGQDGDMTAVERGLRLSRAIHRFWFIRGHFTEGRAWLSALLDLGDKGRVTDGWAYFARGILGPWDRVDFERARAIHQACDDCRGVAWATLGMGVGTAGDLPERVALLDEALQMMRRIGDTQGISWACFFLAAALFDRENDRPRAQALYDEGEMLVRQQGDLHALAVVLARGAAIYYRDGDVARAHALYTESLALFEALGARANAAWARHEMADLAREGGEWGAARDLYAQSYACYRELGLREGSAAVLEGLAILIGDGGQPGQAVRLAAAVDRLFGGRIERDARRRSAITRMLVATRRALGDEAWTRAWAEGRALTLDEAVAAALEAPALTAPSLPRAAPTQMAIVPVGRDCSPLTARECEVAALVARGFTNRAIAAALVIAERTATNHVAHILTKLGCHTRAQVAAWAVAHGLLPMDAAPDDRPV